MYRDHLVSLLKRNVKPALGCTEPAAIALAVSRAQEESRGDIRDVRVRLSGNIFKNARGVGIPGTSEYGIEFAVALALACGDWHKGLEVFADVDEDAVSRAHALLDAVPIQVGLCDAEENFFIEAVVSGAQGTGRAVIIGGHTNMVLVERDGKTVEEAAPAVAEDGKKSAVTPILKDMTIQELRQEVEALPLEEIAFLIAGVPMNYRMAKAGLEQMPGLGLGAALRRLMDEGVIEENMVNKVRMYAAAAADARMAGVMMPVMSNSGSANQGITCTMPVVACAIRQEKSDEELARALIMSHLASIHIKHHLGRLSAHCGAMVAGTAAACGIAMLLGGGLKEMEMTVRNMVGNIAGMICDGAKSSCALKVASAVGAGIQAVMLAMEGSAVPGNEGIVDEDIEICIANLGRLGSTGMRETDKVILDIMLHKK